MLEVKLMINQYNIDKDIQFLAKSEIRLKILSELKKKPRSVKELVNITKITYSSISSNISKLEEHNHISKKKNKYRLNPLSEIYFENLMDFKKSVDIITKYNDFWDKHNISQLSIDSIQNIIDLNDSQLIETTPLDIYKTHNTNKQNIIESKNLKAIFPYLHPEYPQLIESTLRKGGQVELIIPKNMFKEIIFEIDEDVRKDAARSKKLKVYTTKQDLELYLTICDNTMSLGLFKSDGSFDQNRILISGSEKSRIWANDLFKTIKREM